jgi:hypothetical protein
MAVLYRQKWRFFAEQRARYVLFPIAGLWIFIMLLAHDGQLYNALQNGNADASILQQLYFPTITDEQGTQIARATLAAIIILVAYAILIKIAQHQVEKVGYSV